MSHPSQGCMEGYGVVSLHDNHFRDHTKMMLWLFEADDTDNQGYCIYGCAGEFKGIVFLIIGYDEYMILVVSGLDAFDEWSLIRVDDIHLVPLKEELIHGYTLTRNDVTGAVFWVHAGSFDLYKEVGSLECRYYVAVAFVF